jgi:colanic acid biosynthesis glycosyl transferase WcaI
MTIRESLDVTNEFLVVHSGNMGVKQGLEVILGAAQLSRGDKSLLFLIVGDGAVREKLQGEARAAAIQNVRFLPLLADDRYTELLAASDISLVTQQRCVADIVFPSKVITLMASGRAIVASVGQASEVARVLTTARAGLVVPPEDPASLLAAITTLRNDESFRHEIARNARAFARNNWNRDLILAKMEAQLRALIMNRDVTPVRGRRLWSLSRAKTSRA